MKNKNFLTAIAYWFLAIALVLFLSGCRTKKSTTDFKQTETEKIGISDNSTIRKNRTVEEKTDISKTETTADKSFFEAWMSFESDKITITDNQGNKTEISKPKINKKSSQINDITKTEQTDSKTNKVAVSEEIQQSNINATLSKESETDLKTTDERKTKIVWLYVIGAVFVGGFGYLILKKFNLIK